MLTGGTRTLLLVTAVAFTAHGIGFGEGAAEELREERSFTVDVPVEEARAILFDGLDSLDSEVRRTAFAMIRYAGGPGTTDAPGTPDVYEAVQARFRDFRSHLRSPGQFLWQSNAVETLYFLDPEGTVEFLIEHNDQVLGSMDLYVLFSIIGFDKIPLFDNVFWYLDQQVPSDTPSLMFPIAMAEVYLEHRENPYDAVLTHSFFGARQEPSLYARLLEYRIERGLPIEPLYHPLAHAAGIDPSRPVVQRTFTLDELLYQALLYRYEFTDEVYRRDFVWPTSNVVYSNEAAAKYGIETSTEALRRDFAEHTAFPAHRAADALAHVYAGVPRPGDVDRIVAFTKAAEDAVLLEYVHVTADAPPSDVRTALLGEFARHDNASARRESLTALRDSSALQTAFELTELYHLLDSETDPHNQAIVLELLDEIYHDPETLESYLYSRNGIVSTTAAGLILKHRQGAR